VLTSNGVIEWAFEIRPQPIDVSGINIGAENLIYNGRDQKPQLVGVPEHVLTALTVYPFDGLEEIPNAIDAGQYRLEVALSSDDPNYVLTSNKIELAFEIAPMVIDLDAILVEKTYSNTGEDLTLKVFEGLDSEILYYSAMRIEIENGGGGWEEVFSTNYSGRYRIAYSIFVKSGYTNNVTLEYNDSLGSYFTPDYYFNVQ
jgi:hypothetical protein